MLSSPRLLLALLFSAASVCAEDMLAESAVTVALTFTHPGPDTTRAAGGDTEWVTNRLLQQRLGNREILEALVARELIPSVQGWRIVAIWATWTNAEPYAGNAYRFFARRGTGATAETVAIPRDILSVEPLTLAVARRHHIADESTVTEGTETFRVYEQAVIAGPLHTTLTQGIETGTGHFVRPRGETTSRYLPKSSKLTLQGTFDAIDESVFGVVDGYLKYGAARFVSYAPYTDSLGAALTAPHSSTGSGTIVVSGSNTYTGGLGAVGGTVTLVNGAVGPLAPGSATSTLVFTHGGTVALGTGETLHLAPGESIDFSTLSSEERLGMIVTPFTFDPNSGQLTTTPPAP